MTASPTLIALTAAVAWFFVFFVVHIGGLRAGFENARWLLISYVASLLGTLVTVILVTAGHQAIQAVMSRGHDRSSDQRMSVRDVCPGALHRPGVAVGADHDAAARRGGALPEADLYDRFAGRRIIEERLARSSAVAILRSTEHPIGSRRAAGRLPRSSTRSRICGT